MRDLYGRRVVQLLAEEHEIKLVGVSGGPGAGKSDLIRAARRRFGGRVVFLHELATDLKRRGHRFPLKENLRVHYDCLLAEKQTSLEYLGVITALERGCRVVVGDRAVLEKAAYMAGGMPTFEDRLRTTRLEELMRYFAIIFLELPPREIYERIKAGNKTRLETYEEACELHGLTRSLYQGHPGFKNIPNMPTAADKRALGLREIENLL